MGYSKYLADAAAQLYTTSGPGQIQSFIPRSRYQFAVIITLVGTDGADKSFPLNKISSVGMPSYTTRTQTLNQYNKKRVVQTGLDYTPIQLSVYDDVGGEFEEFIKNYSRYYFAQALTVDDVDSFNYDLLNQEFSSSTGNSQAGIKLRTNKQFIKNIVIVRTSSPEDVNVITIYNPFIQSIQADTLNYSESAPVQYNLSFMYEGFDIRSGSTQEQFFDEYYQKVNN